MGPDDQETAEDQVTESSESGDDVDAEAAVEGASEAVSEDAPAEDADTARQAVEELINKPLREGKPDNEAEAESELESVSAAPGARARAEGEAERAQRLAEARHGHGDEEVDTADLVCTVHGGELRQAPGKWRWICDRVQTPGDCVAGERE